MKSTSVSEEKGLMWRVEQSDATGVFYIVKGYNKRTVWVKPGSQAFDFRKEKDAQEQADKLNAMQAENKSRKNNQLEVIEASRDTKFGYDSKGYSLRPGYDEAGGDAEPARYKAKTPTTSSGMYFYNVKPAQVDDALGLGLKQSKSGKWYALRVIPAAEKMFGPGRFWQPKNESVAEQLADVTAENNLNTNSQTLIQSLLSLINEASPLNDVTISDMRDDEEEEEEDNTFYVAFYDEDEDESWIGKVSKEGSKWKEYAYKGKPHSHWGSSYMGYLKPNEVMTWIRKDYARSLMVEGPFYNPEKAIEHALHNFGPIEEQMAVCQQCGMEGCKCAAGKCNCKPKPGYPKN